MLKHDEIKEMFPEYIRGALPEDTKDELECHLKGCRDCREEISFISELIKAEAPDPGELFWKTLPNKVIGAVGEEKAEVFSIISFLFRPLPAAVTIAVLFLLILAYFGKRERTDPALFFGDPLTISVIDYSDINEENITLPAEEITGEETYFKSDVLAGNSYHKDISSLNSEEIASLYEALEKEKKRGG